MARQTSGDGRVWPVSIGGVFPWNPTSVEIHPRDNQPPRAVGNLEARDALRPDQFVDVTLAWDAAADSHSGVVCYAVYRNGTYLDNVLGTSYVDYGQAPDTTLEYEIEPIDRAGNRGPKTPLEFTTARDHTPPAPWRVSFSYADTLLIVSFTEGLGGPSATSLDNYSLSGGATITAARLIPDDNAVELRLRGVVDGGGYVLTVEKVRDDASPANVMVQHRTEFTLTFPPPVSYGYYEAATSPKTLADFDGMTPVKTGSGSAMDLSPALRRDNYALRFTGALNVEQAGPHTFFLRSDDGSMLLVDGDTVIDNDGLHSASEKAGSVDLSAGSHTFEVGYFNAGGDAVLELAYSTVGTDRMPLASSTVVLWQTDFRPGPATASEPTPVSPLAAPQPISVVRGRYGEVTAVVLRGPVGRTVRAWLCVVDLSGRIIRRYDGSLSNGQSRRLSLGPVTSSRRSLAAGMYPCRIRVGDTERALTIVRLPR
jgi:hypothetical protein